MNLELFLNFKGYNLQTIFGIPVRTLQKWLQIIVIVTFLWSCRFLSHLIGVLHVFICYLPPLQIFTCFIYLFCVGTAGLFWRFESLLPMFLLIFNSCVSYGSHFGCLVAHISLNPRTCDSVLQFVIIRHISIHSNNACVLCLTDTSRAHTADEFEQSRVNTTLLTFHIVHADCWRSHTVFLLFIQTDDIDRGWGRNSLKWSSLSEL